MSDTILKPIQIVWIVPLLWTAFKPKIYYHFPQISISVMSKQSDYWDIFFQPLKFTPIMVCAFFCSASPACSWKGKDSGVFTWLMQRLTSLCSKRKQASRWEGDKERAQFTGYWSSPSDLFSILLLRLEYHPRDPLTGISDSVDTLVRAAPPTCHQSSSQHTIKMTSAAGGRRVASLRKRLLSSSEAAVHTSGVSVWCRV